jgi:uncharacterized membrane protein YtjA (UPF0391 family)
MLRLAILFLVIALVAAFLGFGGVAFMAADAARLLFGIFIVLAIIFALSGMFRRSTPDDLL